MKMTFGNTSRAAIAVLTAIATSPHPAAASDLAVLPAAYTMHDDVEGPDGARQADERVTIASGGGGDFVATIAPGTAAPSTVHLTLEGGELRPATAPAGADADDENAQRVSSTIGALALLFGATQNAAQPLASGSQWQSTVHLALPGGEISSIPLTVTAQSVHGTDLRLAATGTGPGTVHAHGHTLHAQVAVDLTAHFHEGRIVDATVARTVTGHVFIKTISFKDTWTVAP